MISTATLNLVSLNELRQEDALRPPSLAQLIAKIVEDGHP
jgi:hypothetical protein